MMIVENTILVQYVDNLIVEDNIIEDIRIIEKEISSSFFVPLEKLVIVPTIVEVDKIIVDEHIIYQNVEPEPIQVSPKYFKSSIFSDNFVVECNNIKKNMETSLRLSEKIKITKTNIYLIENLKIGITKNKCDIIVKYLDKINTFDDLPKFKIGIGKITVEKLKRWYYL
jgi:hypothetical protein